MPPDDKLGGRGPTRRGEEDAGARDAGTLLALASGPDRRPSAGRSLFRSASASSFGHWLDRALRSGGFLQCAGCDDRRGVGLWAAWRWMHKLLMLGAGVGARPVGAHVASLVLGRGPLIRLGVALALGAALGLLRFAAPWRSRW